ncbi:hypothetical protein [Phyllobacterium zundukense]|uniref:Uncharacterized protein n=1 Tax=Phyllobacterium zundukense TaxID=1867719 RepID=A0A2N9W3X4_9HYPH|nr:hypothetical protein [Phyllobacterium zundukense]ATU92084.1 hypothetical protein BLM14_10910 [Phyllobacterium zundukense]PIO46442.1 hypothetical protein B5P45_01155 [Phyllobacterium zundukense]
MMNLRSFALVLAALAFYGFGVANGIAASPAGRFCGEMISSGDYQDVETLLNVDRDGRIAGRYELDEPDGRVEGTLTEKDSAGTSRTLVWTDKYGTGLLELKFSDDYKGFKGRWGGSNNGRFEAPSHSWNGSICTGLSDR